MPKPRSPRSPSRTPFYLATALLVTASTLPAQETNHYAAPFAATAPIIDGVMESIWESARWDSLSYNYLPGTAMPSAADLSARYKVLWTPDALHLLVEVVDDSVSDLTRNPLQNYWQDDCVEVFLDENRDGGNHQYDFGAWAYHVSTKGEVVDLADNQEATLFDDHVLMRRTQSGDTSIWEMSIKVYGDDYALAGPNTPLVLAAPKTMGFSLAYCDNDGKAARESFLGSVNTPGHLANEGYLDASVFGSLELLPAGSTRSTRRASLADVQRGPDGFRLSGPMLVRIHRPDGSPAKELSARAGTWIGSDLPAGLYLVDATSEQGRRSSFVFAKP